MERNDVVLKADRVSAWTPEIKSWWRRRTCKSKVNILTDVSVCIRTRGFVAVIGPSGAGKTTFLTSLAGKCQLPSSGLVTINGADVKLLQRGAVDMVPQRDVFVDSLRVHEHMVFMTELKLGNVKKVANQKILQTLMRELKLKHLENSRISSLSGGERRLLSVATALLSDPQVVLCDEPTTGLDSCNAYHVIGVLKKLSEAGKIVVCSLHQPSSDLFREFDSICLMSDGRLLIHGTHEECRMKFESINLFCPKHYNPAEFYINALSLDMNTKTNSRSIDGLVVPTDELNVYETGSTIDGRRPFITFRRNWFKQIQLLVWRSYITFKRNVINYLFEFFICTLLSALIIGMCFSGISGTTQRGVQDFKGLLWFLCSEVSFIISYNALYVFESDLTLFKKEVGVYSASAFYASRFLNMLPRCIIWPVAYVAVATSAVELPARLPTTAKLIVALIGTAIASTAYGLGMGALFITTGVMGDVMPCVDLPLFLMSGVFIRISSLPLWVHPIKYFSHFFYAMDAISNIYWTQIDSIDCPVNSTSSCLVDGREVLSEAGYTDDFVVYDSLGLALVTLVWTFVGYCGLKREENKGYAY